MKLLDKEKERLKKHYEELCAENSSIKKEAETSFKTLTKTDIDVAKILISFADIYINIGCSPDFYDMDGFSDKKVNLDINDLQAKARRIMSIVQHIKDSDSRTYAAISLIGTKKLLEVSDEIGIGDSNIKYEQMNMLRDKLNTFSANILEKGDNLKVDLQEDNSLLDYEKELHKAIGDLKNINSDLTSIKNCIDKYDEKLKYLIKIYEEYKELVREYIDFTEVKNWKELDKNQNALRAIHTNIAVAQVLHDMISIGVYGDGIKAVKKMIEKADEVINVIEVYLRVSVF